MLKEEVLDKYGNQFVAIFQRLEASIINDIARRLRKTGSWTETAELEGEMLRDLGYSPARIRAEVLRKIRADPAYVKFVDQNTLEIKQAKQKAINIAKEELRQMVPEFFDEIGNMAFRNDLSLWADAGQELPKGSQLSQLCSAYARRTQGELLDLTRSTAFVYHGVPREPRAVFRAAMNDCITKVATGVSNVHSAISDAVREMARSGLRKVDYASGRSYQLDTAARMTTRTSCAQLAGDICDQNMRETGVGHVEVSSHWGARDSHAAWQGGVYTYDDFVSICGYGEPGNPDHIYSYNCRHLHYPFWPGISKPHIWEVEPGPFNVNGRQYTYYQATQQQRSMERNIRALRREQNAGNDVPDSRIKDAILKYHEFSDAVNIKPRDDLLRVIAI